MKKYTPLEQTQETAKMLQEKPEIDRKVEYYKKVIYSNANLITSIGETIERGYKTETISFIFPFKKKIVLDSYDISKLEIEKLEAEYELDAQKNYFEMWMERSIEYDKKFSILLVECEANWDKVYELALQVAEYNLRLSSIIGKYDKANTDKKIKVEAYLYFKQEVENAQKAGRLKMPNPKHQAVMEKV